MKCATVLVLCLGFVVGCNTGERLTRLEKQSNALKEEVEKDHAKRDLDLQAKCSKDAWLWFGENWSRDKDTIYLDFTNHYNVKMNKCFILVEYHFNSHLAVGGDSWTNDMHLVDVYENAKYAEFLENHYTYWKPTRTSDEVISCDGPGEKCKTKDEFYNLVRPYMND